MNPRGPRPRKTRWRLTVGGLMIAVASVSLGVNEFRPVGREEAIRIAKDLVRTQQPAFPLDHCLIEVAFTDFHGQRGGRRIDKSDSWLVVFSRTPKMVDLGVAVKTRRDVEIVIP